MEKVYMNTEDMNEIQFLEWLYEIIGDDEIDYMWIIAGRIGELKQKIQGEN